MNRFGHLPTRGENITIDSFEFKIINADARRIKLIECIDKRKV
jgi:magnesium and cobalt transporter